MPRLCQAAWIFSFVLAIPVSGQQTPQPSGSLDHTQLMVFRDAQGIQKPVTSVADWKQRRADVLRGMEATMGPLPGPDRRCPLNIKI
ncbi:MAG: hypothetical protein GY917_25970, partial [Planctomycetaceae bacterium]|nr:hypothetical protein [Planctomycetaceae bacterium]